MALSHSQHGPGHDPAHLRAGAAVHGLRQLFWALVAGTVVAYVFFLALGAFGPGEVAVLTAAVAVLAVLWAAHGVRTARDRGRDEAARHDRERRGF